MNDGGKVKTSPYSGETPPFLGWKWRIGLTFIFLWFFLGGMGHFAFTQAFASIVPPQLPHPRLWVWLTGGCEIAGACALLMGPSLRAMAGWALIALTVCVTPANVEMLI